MWGRDDDRAPRTGLVPGRLVSGVRAVVGSMSTVDDLVIAFAMRCDDQGMTYEAGVRAAEELADALAYAAEDRAVYATSEEQGDND